MSLFRRDGKRYQLKGERPIKQNQKPDWFLVYLSKEGVKRFVYAKCVSNVSAEARSQTFL